MSVCEIMSESERECVCVQTERQQISVERAQPVICSHTSAAGVKQIQIQILETKC